MAKKTMKKLSAELKEKYGKGFDFSSLYKYVKFHQEFPQILDSLRPKSGRPLSWTHYRILLQETSAEARAWYAKEAQEQTWSVRTLQRNISSQYYYRMLMSQNVEPVEKEMKELTASYQADKLEFIKNPVIAEFLGLSSNTRLYRKRIGAENYHAYSKISHGVGERICVCKRDNSIFELKKKIITLILFFTITF